MGKEERIKHFGKAVYITSTYIIQTDSKGNQGVSERICHYVENMTKNRERVKFQPVEAAFTGEKTFTYIFRTAHLFGHDHGTYQRERFFFLSTTGVGRIVVLSLKPYLTRKERLRRAINFVGKLKFPHLPF